MALRNSLALFILFNILFFTLTTATRSVNCPPSPHKSKHNKHKPSPSPTPTTGTCPKDALKLGVCVNALNLLKDVTIGTPPVTPCCSLIDGLVDLEAAVCLCTALKRTIAFAVSLAEKIVTFMKPEENKRREAMTVLLLALLLLATATFYFTRLRL